MNHQELMKMNRHLEKMLKLYEENNRDLRRLLALREKQYLMNEGQEDFVQFY